MKRRIPESPHVEDRRRKKPATFDEFADVRGKAIASANAQPAMPMKPGVRMKGQQAMTKAASTAANTRPKAKPDRMAEARPKPKPRALTMGSFKGIKVK